MFESPINTWCILSRSVQAVHAVLLLLRQCLKLDKGGIALTVSCEFVKPRHPYISSMGALPGEKVPL